MQRIRQLHLPNINAYHHIQFSTYIDITDTSLVTTDRQKERAEKAQQSTVPQIYVEDECIGGCDSLIESMASGLFFKKLIQYGVAHISDSYPNTANSTPDSAVSSAANSPMSKGVNSGSSSSSSSATKISSGGSSPVDCGGGVDIATTQAPQNMNTNAKVENENNNKIETNERSVDSVLNSLSAQQKAVLNAYYYNTNTNTNERNNLQGRSARY